MPPKTSISESITTMAPAAVWTLASQETKDYYMRKALDNKELREAFEQRLDATVTRLQRKQHEMHRLGQEVGRLVARIEGQSEGNE